MRAGRPPAAAGAENVLASLDVVADLDGDGLAVAVGVAGTVVAGEGRTARPCAPRETSWPASLSEAP